MTGRRGRGIAIICGVLVVASAVFGGSLLSLTAPFSGAAFETTDDAGAATVDSPYGEAEVRFDEYGVPHVNAETEEALYFAVGYVQAQERLFQMDLQRRNMNGTLSELAGNDTVETDRFARKMGFRDAAMATWRSLRETEHGAKLRAYSAGVNRYIDTQPLPIEFRLNGYEPRSWRPVDSLLVAQQISWGLSGEFSDLRRATIERTLPEAGSLYPRKLDHDQRIIDGTRPGHDWRPNATRFSAHEPPAVGQLYDSLSEQTPPRGIGSNNWVVSGNLTAGGDPLLANDPHLPLTAPPVWYEMHLRAADLDVRGVGFAGIPFAVLGTNQDVSWGVTNVGADVTDTYSYEWRDGKYWYDGSWREPTTSTETIQVDGAENREVTVQRTVHGPVLEEEGQRVAVAWTGLTAQNQSLAFDRLAHADTIGEVETALRDFHVPAQNFVAAEREVGGDTLYYPAGKYPIRRVDGEAVPGNRVFNGSAGHGEWAGYTPYGNSTWDGFVPYEAIPHLENPEYLATANQRVVGDADFYLGTSMQFASPYRGERIYDMLENRTADGGDLTSADMQAIQRDTVSLPAASLVPQILDSTDAMAAEQRAAAQDLADWDYRMEPDSREALLFARWREAYMNATFGDEYHRNGLDEAYYPHLWTLQELPPNSTWFDDTRTDRRESRADVIARALRTARQEIESEGWETYGEYNTADIDHEFPLSFLDYPAKPIGGSPYTVSNYRATQSGRPAGSSWRLVANSTDAIGVIPGGNSGRYFSPHYDDQYDLWRTGGYKLLSFDAGGSADIVFREAGS